ncbi:protein phosphatase Slingshot-like 1 isoform X2 [Silurus asotus]|uniref:Protein phosphatase Slingshot-like 1 isoform X2 n=1 Tax=Silurus asotus TaxID=30991 RepID=A0AAD5A1X8_SILAS|nr:protein phosphatase Slingshot-like 1 isoform X2 [Silurus asotus]
MALLTLQRSPPLAAHKDLVSDDQKADSSLCESFYMVKGAALFLQQGGIASCPKTQLHQENSVNVTVQFGLRQDSLWQHNYKGEPEGNTDMRISGIRDDPPHHHQQT